MHGARIPFFSVNDKRILLLSRVSHSFSYLLFCNCFITLSCSSYAYTFCCSSAICIIIKTLIPTPIFSSPYAQTKLYSNRSPYHFINNIYIRKTQPHDHNDRIDHPNPCRNVFIFSIFPFAKCLYPGLMFCVHRIVLYEYTQQSINHSQYKLLFVCI